MSRRSATAIADDLRRIARMPRRSTTAEVTPIRSRSFGAAAKTTGRWRANPHPEITELEIRFLKALISDYGSTRVAKWMRVSESVVLRIAAGVGFRCRPDTMAAVRAFFAEADLESAQRGEGQPLPDVPGRDSPQKRGMNATRRKTE